MMRILLILVLLSAFGCSGAAQDKPKTTDSSKSETTRSRTEPIKVGEIAPDFALADENGRTTTLSAFKQPTVVVFYRGYW